MADLHDVASAESCVMEDFADALIGSPKATSSFVVRSDKMPHITKDPNAVLDYRWDWTRWMKDIGVVALASAEVTVDPGLTLVGSARITDGVVSQIIGGGVDGQSYAAMCRVVAASFTDDRTVIIDIENR